MQRGVAVGAVQHGGERAEPAVRPADAKAPQDYDLWNLYCTVRRRRPKLVMEFGCGCSTLVMAQALAENGDGGLLIVVEAMAQWLEASMREMPSRLARHVDYRHLPLVRGSGWQGEHHYFGGLPLVRLDMIYLDGPNPADSFADWSGEPVSADALLLESRFRPGFRMVVDSRKANVAFLRRELRRRYRVRTHDIFGVTTFDLVEEEG